MSAVGPRHAGVHIPVDAARMPALDTSYVCVTDRHGNVFSATPSDTSSDTPVVPGTGLCPSSRGVSVVGRPGPRHRPSHRASGRA